MSSIDIGSPEWHAGRAKVLAAIGSKQRRLRVKLGAPAPTADEIAESDRWLRIATYGMPESAVMDYPEANESRADWLIGVSRYALKSPNTARTSRARSYASASAPCD